MQYELRCQPTTTNLENCLSEIVQHPKPFSSEESEQKLII